VSEARFVLPPFASAFSDLKRVVLSSDTENVQRVAPFASDDDVRERTSSSGGTQLMYGHAKKDDCVDQLEYKNASFFFFYLIEATIRL